MASLNLPRTGRVWNLPSETDPLSFRARYTFFARIASEFGILALAATGGDASGFLAKQTLPWTIHPCYASAIVEQIKGGQYLYARSLKETPGVLHLAK